MSRFLSDFHLLIKLYVSALLLPTHRMGNAADAETFGQKGKEDACQEGGQLVG
jgi:hypothetical protein